ncbi:MAG: ATP-binding protein [Melioribacteraceae bacterium]|nr:ATP-binding protein [Melioribacteraceae bacterium]
MLNKLAEGIKRYRFEFKHLTVIFVVMIIFQLTLSFIQKNYLHNYLVNTQQLYQRESVENMANLVTTSLEMLLENINVKEIESESKKTNIIKSFNIIFSQQLLQKNTNDVCLLVHSHGKNIVLDDGKSLYNFLKENNKLVSDNTSKHLEAVKYFKQLEKGIHEFDEIHSILIDETTFHIFVPFVPNGEYLGLIYLKKTPDFSNISDEIISSYDEAAVIYSSLILLGLLAMYYISSFTVKERDDVQRKLYEENEKHLMEQIHFDKESQFAQRIYHTHHKAEKVMGFIKDDLRNVTYENFLELKDRVVKYSNFISRVIYDMKSFDPPVSTIRNQMFRTNLNDVIDFILNHIFLRISQHTDVFKFKVEHDENIPLIHINEFVVWEIIEPLIQNCIDHSGVEPVEVTIKTRYNPETGITNLFISDNGNGFSDEMLTLNDDGIKKIFEQNISSKTTSENSGYGCYIAYEMATKRCGWKLDSYNKTAGKGACFEISIKN